MAVKCSSCGKMGWQGCGAHVEQVLGHVPAEERCRCREQAAPPPDAQKSVMDWVRRGR
jgi:hypothetical protein